MGTVKTRLGVSATAISVFALLFAGPGVRVLVGPAVLLGLEIALALTAAVVLARHWPSHFRWYQLPAPLFWFGLIVLVSATWSAAPLTSLAATLTLFVTAAVGVALALVLTWQELLRTLSTALRYVLGFSLALELGVALFVQHPVGAWWSGGRDPVALLSEGALVRGGAIQGFTGSPIMLGFVAVLALTLWGVQLRAGLVRPVIGWFWVVIAVACLLLSRSTTAWVAFVVVAITLAFALAVRRHPPEERTPIYVIGAVLLGAAITTTVLARDFVFGLFGRSPELAGHSDVWAAAWRLIGERFWFGWGWVGEMGGGSGPAATSLPAGARNAWLDVWVQLGLVGFLLFLPLVVLTVWRVWFRAVDQPRRGAGPALPYATSALWPLLVTVALVVQSFTESELLSDGGWLLLVVLAVKTKIDSEVPSLAAEPKKLPWRRMPIVRGA